ncbi:Rpn family recombination-promoting nuclease/putative transposase [Haliangium sp.]|uniref:Rpn family recombination-promoting nuclease/putative transposase n=1 Tax=Haliangium sp. TaxID=2663208 RepID=UPI003D0EF8BD
MSIGRMGNGSDDRDERVSIDVDATADTAGAHPEGMDGAPSDESGDELPSPPRTAHDAFFKKLFSAPEHAAAELRAVVPERVAAHVAWDTLRLEHASAVGDWLRQQHGDLVYSASLADGRSVLLWFLFEHQSTVTHLMAWEVLQKAVSLLRAWLDQRPRAKHLPPLLSFVLYTGSEPWTAPTSLDGLIDISEEARRDLDDHLLTYRYFLDDLHATPTEAIDARILEPLIRLGLVVMKHAPSDHILDQLHAHHADISTLLRTNAGWNWLKVIVYYVWSVNQQATRDRILERLEPVIGPEIEHAMLTYAQQLERQGFDNGFDKGHDKGREHGQRTLLLRQLRARFGDLPEAISNRVNEAGEAELEEWGERLMFADSLDGVFTVP